uniref:FERM domain-containing protein 8 n=1 Tax=Anopheles albimanus TaxID=7167 RepID=A0A182FQ52_ANOAL
MSRRMTIFNFLFELERGPASSSGSNNNYQLGNGNTGEQQKQQQQQQSKYTTTTTGNSTSAAATKQPLQQQQQQQQQQSSFTKPSVVQPQQQQSASLSGHLAQHPASVSYLPTSGGGPVAGSGLLRPADSNPFASSTTAASQHHLQQHQQQQHQQQYQQPLQPQTGSVNVNVTVNVVARSVTAGTMTTTTATTTSTTTLAPPRPMQKVIPTVVYLMSRIAVHMEIEGTAQCPAQVMLAAALGCEELGITNKLLAQSVFGLWMTSPLLEVQLKPHHRPYAVRVAWSKLLDKHSHGNELEKLSDEPMTTLRRNVFFSRKDEEKIKDPRILELLYEEARHNVLLGRYVMEPSQSIMLGGIQARIELGPYNSHTHTTSYFRENQFRFLPAHVAKSSSWSWLPISQRSSAEVRLLEQFKRVPTTATTKKLMRKYLEFCWGLPFYGAAYFHGQVEQPVRGLMSLMQQKDLPVLIAVNERGIFVIDQIECTLLLGLKYEEFSWEYAKPSNVNDPECLPCIFLQFGAVENGIAATKLMQIFSRQAAMVDALITHFIEQDKRRKESGADADQAGGLADNTYVEPNPIKNNGIGVLSNKFARLTLATFDDEGRCIGQTGSLSISY